MSDSFELEELAPLNSKLNKIREKVEADRMQLDTIEQMLEEAEQKTHRNFLDIGTLFPSLS
jgi:hypothetical protein